MNTDVPRVSPNWSLPMAPTCLEHPLGDADTVLARAAGDELHGVVAHELLVERQVLVLGEDGVVEGDAVLGEDLHGHLGRDVQQRVAHAQDRALQVHVRALCH
jgi:hypothetical protein